MIGVRANLILFGRREREREKDVQGSRNDAGDGGGSKED